MIDIKAKTVTVMCTDSDCPGYGPIITVPVAEVMPGVLALPDLYCGSCGRLMLHANVVGSIERVERDLAAAVGTPPVFRRRRRD